jgi:lysophosphatidic acid acyltransferase/lysophosphatidylinositol acyltransferase
MVVLILFRCLSFLSLLVFLLLINFFQLLSLLVLPVSKNLFRNFNTHCGALWWYCLSWVLENICGVQVEILGLPEPKNSHGANVLLLANHQSIIDPLIILILARRLGGLRYLKWFVKESLLYVPFLGWGLWFLDCVFLKRNWNQDEKSIASHFQKILRLKDPVWLVSFPEGTRKTERGLLEGKKFAEMNGQKPFERVLFPRYKGFLGNMEGMGNRLEWIYDLTLVYFTPKLSWVQLFTGDLGRVKIVLEKIPRQELPLDSKSLRLWLIDRFRKKDAILADFEN